jgi:hypothetical protein
LRAIQGAEGRRGDRDHRGPRTNLLKAIIASQLLRLSLKGSFSQNNHYHDNRIIFRRKTNIIWSSFFSRKWSEMIIVINPNIQFNYTIIQYIEFFFFIFHNFLLCCPSQRSSAILGGNPPGDWQSAVGWGDAGFEPGTAGQQSGVLPLSHHASHLSHHASLSI